MRLKELYKKEILSKLKSEIGFTNEFLAPKIEKVVLNVGFGRVHKEKAFIDNVEKSLIAISGQKPVFTKAKKSISAFKIREGLIIGAKVTLRGNRMYDFVDKLVNVTFPRVRDFRGIDEKSVDGSGNLNIGIKENTPFPEIVPGMSENVHGLEITIATSAKTRDDGLKLFKLIGFPFKK